MTNRQMVMVKLIQLSDEQFAELLVDEIGLLANDTLCKECREQNGGECITGKNSPVECQFDLVKWLQQKVS